MTDDDYTHERHAGNVGDVFKHHGLGLTLEALTHPGAPALRYVESHAGHGVYDLGPTGEWTAGVGRLLASTPTGTPTGAPTGAPTAAPTAAPTGAPDRIGGPWLPLVRAFNPRPGRPTRYPGSPRLAAALLRPDDRAALFERDARACERLARALGDDARFAVAKGDGYAGALEALAGPWTGETLLAVDPPYSDRADWQKVAETLVAAVRRLPTLRAVCWYPVKSLARPNALVHRLQEAGLRGTLFELVTKPFDQKKKQLNGSGLLLVAPPDGVPSRLAAALPDLGAACSHDGAYWSARLVHW